MGRCISRVVSVLMMAVIVSACSLGASEAESRGLLDSVVSTLVGGNPGDGATDAKLIPLGRNVSFPLFGIARDSAGNIYYADNQRILKQTAAGVVSVIAGADGTAGFRGDGDVATRALLSDPRQLAVDSKDNIFVVDSSNRRIRKINAADGKISTVAGTGESGNSGQLSDIGRLAVDARISTSDIVAIAINAAGDIFSADNDSNVIYKIDATTGIISLVAGIGQSGGPTKSGDPAAGNALLNIRGMALLSTGDIVYSENNCIRVISVTTGTNTVVAGLLSATSFPTAGTGPQFPDDGTQNALQNSPTAFGNISSPRQIAVDGSTIIFWDSSNRSFRSFTVGGKISTIFGAINVSGSSGFRGDSGTAATNTGSTTDDDARANRSNNTQFVAASSVVTFIDDGNRRVRQFTVAGTVNSIAGAFSPFRNSNIGTNQYAVSDNAAVSAQGALIGTPGWIAADSSCNLYFDADNGLSSFLPLTNNRNIYKYDATAKTLAVLAGLTITNGFQTNIGDGGPATTACLNGVGSQIFVASDNSVLFADTDASGGSSSTVRKIDGVTGKISTIAGIPGVFGGIDPDGDATLSTPTTTRAGKQATKVLLDSPLGVTVSGTTVLIADTNNGDVLKVDSAGILTLANTVAGTVTAPAFLIVRSSDSSILTASGPTAGNNLVQRISTAGAVTTFATCAATVQAIALGTNGLYAGLSNGTIEVYAIAGVDGTAPTLTITNPGVVLGMAVNGTVVTYTTAGRVIRQFTDTSIAAPTITTVAGQFFDLIGTGGPGLNAGFSFNSSTPLAFIGSDILVGDDGTEQLRRVTLGTAPASTASLFAGTGSDSAFLTGEGGPGTSATILSSVGGIEVSADGSTVYFSDKGQNTIRRITGGLVDTYVGIPGRAGFSGNGLNRLLTILNSPSGLALNAAGELVFAEGINSIIRKVNADSTISLIGGFPLETGYAGDGYSGALSKFSDPEGLVFNKNGDLYAADVNNEVIRIISSLNIVSTLAGNSGGHDVSQVEADALEADIGSPLDVTVDTAGKIYSTASGTSLIYRTANGKSIAVAGISGPSSGLFNGDGLPGPRTLIDSPESLVFCSTLGLVFSDTGNNRVRVLTNLAETTNTAPTAVIVATPGKQGSVPFKVRFDGSTSLDADGDIVVYSWDFGDGSTGNGPIVEHTYTTANSYTVTLTVTDSQGNTSTAKLTVIASTPLLASSSSGSGSFKIAFGTKGKNKDSFTLVLKNITGLTDVSGKTATITIGSFTITGIVAGKGVKTTSKQVKLIIDAAKKTVGFSLKGVELDSAFSELGVIEENTIGTQQLSVPVVINVNSGAMVIGDKFLFNFVSKFGSGASGKFAQ